MNQLYPWLVFVHLLGVFAFLMAHGVSVFVSFRVKAERDLIVLRALLALSARSVVASRLSLLVLLVGGIGAALVGHIQRDWPWAALGLLIVEWGLMSAFPGRELRKVRIAAGFTGPVGTAGEAKSEALAAALAKHNPMITLLIGGLGLALILWLMVMKPF